MPDPVMGGSPIALSPATYDRHEAAARYVERLPRNRNPLGPTSRFPGAAWLRKAKTGGSGIPAATANDTPGSATVTFCDWDSGTGTWVVGTETATALNPSTAGAVTANWIITVAWVGGQWEANMDPC